MKYGDTGEGRVGGTTGVGRLFPTGKESLGVWNGPGPVGETRRLRHPFRWMWDRRMESSRLRHRLHNTRWDWEYRYVDWVETSLRLHIQSNKKGNVLSLPLRVVLQFFVGSEPTVVVHRVEWKGPANHDGDVGTDWDTHDPYILLIRQPFLQDTATKDNEPFSL